MAASKSKSTTPGAIRGRKCRANKADGLVCLRLWVHRKRFIAAARCTDRLQPDATQAEIATVATEVLADYVERWIGPDRA